MGISLLISTTSGIFAYVVCYDQNNDLLTYSAFFATVGVFWFMISLVANNKIAKTANEVFSIFFGLIVVIKDTILDFLPEELNIDQYINFSESGYSDAQVIKMLIDVIATPLLAINATTKPAPEWTETKSSGTKYVNTDCYSRKKAVLGADTVKLYSVNDKVTVIAKTDTGYFKLSDGSFIHSDYLSDSKVAQTTTTTTKKAETVMPAATTTKKQESEPKSIYEYPFDLEAIRQVIIDDAVNNYGLVLNEKMKKDESPWFAPLVIWKDVNPNVIRMRVSEEAESSYTGGYMQKGDHFNVYIETVPNLKTDENGNSIEGYAIYFLRGNLARN